MKKRIFVLALCMCMVFGLFPVNASAAWNTWSNSSDLGQMLANCATAQKGKTRSDLGLSGIWCAFFVGACARKVGIDSSILPPADGNHYTTTISGSGKPAATSTGWGYGQYVVDKCGGKKLTASDTPRAGDLAVWGSHVGIMISSTQCVSGNMGTDSATSVVVTHSAEGGYGYYENSKFISVNPLFYVRPNYGGSSTTWTPTSSTTLTEYLQHCTVSTFSATATPKSSSVKVFDMPWANEVNGDQKTPYITTTGSLTVTKEVKNHVGNTWYEVNGKYVYSGDVNIISFPKISFTNISETNAHIDSHWISNPNQVYCQYGGAIWSTSSLANVLPKTKSEIDNSTRYNSHYEAVADTWQTRTSIENSWDFNSSFKWALEKSGDGKTTNLPQGTLQANTTYYVRLFVIDKAGNVYLSVQNSFKTSVHGGLSSWTKVDGSNHKRTCSVCSAVETAAHTWDNGSVTKAATCSATGVKTYTCTACKATKTETIAKISHSYTYKATTNPTTSAAGILTGTCSKCSGTTTVTLPKLDTTNYTYSVTKAATCSATGTGRYTWKTITYGTYSFDVSIAKKSHTAGTPQLEKTNMVTRCTVCNTIITSTTVITKDMSLEDYLSYYPSEPCSGYITPVSSELGSIYRLPSAFNVDGIPTGDRNGQLTTTKKVIGKNVNPWGNLWYQIDDGFVYYGDVIFVESMIELNRTSKSICVGQTFNLIATFKPENAENKNVTWTSSNNDIVTVITDHGTIQGIATGTAVVTATSAADPDVTATCTITVKEHNYTYQIIEEPTVSSSGMLQGTCSLCSGTTTVTLPKLDTENYTMVITKEPTTTTEGTAQYTLIDKTYGSVVISVELPCLTAFTLPRSLTRIEAEAFSNVSADVIVIPANVKAIDELAFANCPNLRYLVFQGSPTTIASNILEGCSNVTIRCISGSYVSRWAVVMGYAVEEQ